MTDNEYRAVLNALGEILLQETEMCKVRQVRREKDPKAPLDPVWADEVNESADIVVGVTRLISFLEKNDINSLHMYSRNN